MTGYILGREIPNVGEWTKFSPAQLANLQKKQIEIPEPIVSTHTIPENKWMVAMPNVSGALPLQL
jgi:hypothetical protein